MLSYINNRPNEKLLIELIKRVITSLCVVQIPTLFLRVLSFIITIFPIFQESSVAFQ